MSNSEIVLDVFDMMMSSSVIEFSKNWNSDPLFPPSRESTDFTRYSLNGRVTRIIFKIEDTHN